MGNVVLSFAIAAAVVGLAGVWFLKTSRRAQKAISNLVSTRTDTLATLVLDLRDRVHHLEEHGASVASTNAAFDEVHARIVSIEPPPKDLKTEAEMVHWAITKRLLTPSAHNVGHPLTIHSAVYEVDGGKKNDVTELVRSSVKDNRVRMQVNNETMGGDPHHGVKKQLRVSYGCDGVTREAKVREGGELKIPE